MVEKDAVSAFSALAHPLRLRVIRLLMREGPGGLPAGQIAEALRTPPSTLSSHLAQLQRTGLVRSERQQQRILYAASLGGTRALIDFLIQDCCNGHPEVCGYLGSPSEYLHTGNE
ncbi:MAG: ArsR/SmtB family transcription factor [Gammaproteobacteria bacterium]